MAIQTNTSTMITTLRRLSRATSFNSSNPPDQSATSHPGRRGDNDTGRGGGCRVVGRSKSLCDNSPNESGH